MRKQDKVAEFTALLLDKVQEVFDTYQQETGELLVNNENLEDFMYAIGNLLPCYVINKLTGRNADILENNHEMNSLIIKKALEEGTPESESGK
jgi:hypothetical protein